MDRSQAPAQSPVSAQSVGWYLLAAIFAFDLWLNAVRLLTPAEAIPWLQPTIATWALAQVTATSGYLVFGRRGIAIRLVVSAGVLLGAAECCFIFAPYWPSIAFTEILLRGGIVGAMTTGWLVAARLLGLRALRTSRATTSSNPFRFSLTHYFALVTGWAVMLAFSRGHWEGVWGASVTGPWLAILSLLGAVTIIATLGSHSLGDVAKGLVLAMVIAPSVAGVAIGISVAVLFVYCGLVALLASAAWHIGWRVTWEETRRVDQDFSRTPIWSSKGSSSKFTARPPAMAVLTSKPK